MAVTIVRTPWIDDDGTGTTGTVINNAVKTALYNDIDGALAKVPQLAGGNAFAGNQGIAGVVTVSGFGAHQFNAAGTGGNTLSIQNSVAGATNYAALLLGNDAGVGQLVITSYSSTYTPSSFAQPNGSAIYQGGVGGLSLVCGVGAPLRLSTTGVERARVTPTGDLLINCTTNPSVGHIGIVSDLAAKQNIVCQNSNPGNAGNFLYFLNSAAAAAGQIQHTGATSVLYQTTSDARLKDDAGRATDLAALRAVVVHDFAWKADGVRDRGVFAQDAHALYPRAVSPGTDETTESGDLARPWMTDYSKFVPDLIVGWQQHDAELAEIRAALAIRR
jgi:hypothetical protein